MSTIGFCSFRATRVFLSFCLPLTHKIVRLSETKSAIRTGHERMHGSYRSECPFVIAADNSESHTKEPQIHITLSCVLQKLSQTPPLWLAMGQRLSRGFVRKSSVSRFHYIMPISLTIAVIARTIMALSSTKSYGRIIGTP
jgi:hypothetical protein